MCEVENANNIFIGANALDYSGYPDCREDFIKKFEDTLQTGNKLGIEKKNTHTKTIDTLF